MAVSKIGPKFQVVIPKKVREAAKLSVGDFVETTAVKDGVLIRPKVVVDRDLDTALGEALADVAAGRVSKSYSSAPALVRDLKRRGHRARAKH
jgi:AbrB family looped-hinge helix DNA binding protein